jgi:ribonuclease T
VPEPKAPIAHRFRGFLPVVIDVETGGFNADTDALLEIAAVLIEMDDRGRLCLGEQFFFNVEPFEGANIEPAALEFTGINPDSALRGAPRKRRVNRNIQWYSGRGKTHRLPARCCGSAQCIF